MFGNKDIFQIFWARFVKHLQVYNSLSPADYISYELERCLQIPIFQENGVSNAFIKTFCDKVISGETKSAFDFIIATSFCGVDFFWTRFLISLSMTVLSDQVSYSWYKANIFTIQLH